MSCLSTTEAKYGPVIYSPRRIMAFFMPYGQKTHGLSTEVNLIRGSGLRSNIAGEKSCNLVTLEFAVKS